MSTKKSTYQIWYEKVKKELLITEPQNIMARSRCCQDIINECVSHIHARLGLTELNASQQYVCAVKPQDHLKFLLNWPGLRVDNSPKAPNTKKEYEKKSKNWLNGRRAPNYGKTLFPFFIADAERYVLSIAKSLIPAHNQEQMRLYCDIVIYKILAQLCGCSVTLHEQAKKAPFFCKNSIERKGKLKEILQSYASDHEYIQGFPSCFEEAIGYFDRKSNVFFREYKKHMAESHSQRFDDGDISLESDRIAVSSPLRSGSAHMRNGVHIPKPPKPEYPPAITRTRGVRPPAANIANARETTHAGYWKHQFMKLKRELTAERHMRITLERERDNLKTLIQRRTSTIQNQPIGGLQVIPLQNDGSYDSFNGSSGTVSSASSAANSNMMMMNSIPSYNVQQNHVPSTSNGFTSNNFHNNSPAHYYQSAVSSFVDNGANGNVYNLNNIGANQFHPSRAEMHSNINANDRFPPGIMDTMPIVNAPQRSNERYAPQFNGLQSPTASSLYSLQNMMIANNDILNM